MGVRNFYLAPGARSQALAIAAGQLSKSGHVSLTVVLDERAMGFAGLGRALGSGTPSVLITTSGTAVANLHPAILEASHSGIPLIVLTADRPESLRNKGANQTTMQPGIFADAVRISMDIPAPTEALSPNPRELAEIAVTHAMGENPGPVHLNLQFSEPLSSAEPNAAGVYEGIGEQKVPLVQTQISELDIVVDDHTVVVAGPGAGDSAVEFAQLANLPLFAEPTSGARFGPNAINGYPLKIAGPLGAQIRKVIVFGKPTLTRAVIGMINKSEVWVQKSATHGHFDVGSNALGFADQLRPIGAGSERWLEAWSAGEVQTDSRTELATLLWERTQEGEQLLFGASELIRKADSSVPPKRISAYANRGLSGIDGTISTALGLAQNGKQTRALIGDLTLLHDAGGLNKSGFDDLDVQVIIGNDHGGAIFRNLEMAKTLDAALLEQLFLTPQSASIEHLALAYGWKYFSAQTPEQLEPLLGEKGFVLIEYLL